MKSGVSTPPTTATLTTTVALILAFIWLIRKRSKLAHIPTIGPSAPLLTYLGAYRYMTDAPKIIQEGYKKYGSIFKIPTPTGWTVVISGPERIKELSKAPESISSSDAANKEWLQPEFTMWPAMAEHGYEIDVLRVHMTKHIGTRFHDILNEVEVACSEHIPLTSEWSKFAAFQVLPEIAFRVNNRYFFGAPLCWNKDYRTFNISFAEPLIKAGLITSLFPRALRRSVVKYLTNVSQYKGRIVGLLRPMVEERLQLEAKFGPEWPERPDDLLTWLIQYDKKAQRDVVDLALRIVVVNFFALATTAGCMAHIIFSLVAHPEYIEPLRSEMESIIAEEGITKGALLKMVKLDSFIKESLRHGGVGTLTMPRKMLQDFTFSDGVVIPEGAWVAAAHLPMHLDQKYYDSPHEFNGFRFAENIKEGDNLAAHSVSALSLEYILFGGGRNACPGRYFAVNEMKLFFVHLLRNYDLGVDPNAPPYKQLWFSFLNIPDQSASVLVRKRHL